MKAPLEVLNLLEALSGPGLEAGLVGLSDDLRHLQKRTHLRVGCLDSRVEIRPRCPCRANPDFEWLPCRVHPVNEAELDPPNCPRPEWGECLEIGRFIPIGCSPS